MIYFEGTFLWGKKTAGRIKRCNCHKYRQLIFIIWPKVWKEKINIIYLFIADTHREREYIKNIYLYCLPNLIGEGGGAN